jgi:ribonuclease HII
VKKALSETSVGELRHYYLREGGNASAQIIAQMKADPRSGVRKIAERLENEIDRRREESSRLDQLLRFENRLREQGLHWIAGVDEVGVGPLAGPVVAAAVVFPPEARISGVDDSKRLSAQRREILGEEIRRTAHSIGIGAAEVAEIDQLNVYQAGLLAMRRAVKNLSVRPDHLLVDAREVPGLDVPQTGIIRGDSKCFTIAAASIIAKTHRDSLMIRLGSEFPDYGFARHKGYPTLEHQAALRRHGPCRIHRRSFVANRELAGEFSGNYHQLRRALSEARTSKQLSSLELDLRDPGATSLSELERQKLLSLLERRHVRLAKEAASAGRSDENQKTFPGFNL